MRQERAFLAASVWLVALAYPGLRLFGILGLYGVYLFWLGIPEC